MANDSAPWARPHFTPGGGDPLVFYAVFGQFDLKKPLSRSKYRTSGLPDWLDLVNCDRAKEPEVFEEFLTGKVWEILSRDTPLTANEAAQAAQCVVLRGEPTDPPTLEYFRDAVGIVTWLLDAGGLAVYDPQMLWLWSADEWREDAFAPNAPNPERHTSILMSEEPDGTSWYHTVGMRKFGRPDVSIHGVSTRYADAVSELIEQFVELQSLGAVIPEGETVQMEDLPEGGVCYHRGDPDDPDFNNDHIEIEWPGNGLR